MPRRLFRLNTVCYIRNPFSSAYCTHRARAITVREALIPCKPTRQATTAPQHDAHFPHLRVNAICPWLCFGSQEFSSKGADAVLCKLA
jgi:hypothetical protein